jgi:hypothetical protein
MKIEVSSWNLKFLVVSSIGMLLFIGCSSPKKLGYPEIIDTTTKPIVLQQKQQFSFPEMQLHLSNEFDGARLNKVEKVNDSLVLITIQPENEPINMSPYYAFKIWSEIPKTINISFNYPEGFRHRYVPKLQRTDEAWERVDPSNIFVQDSLFSIRVEVSKDTLLVAAQERFTSSEIAAWSESLHKEHNFIRPSSVGETVLGRSIPLLDIYKGDPKGKKIIVLLTRQHPPEVTGFLAFKSFMNTLLNSEELTESFFNRYRVLAFPLMNPDGVDLGHWRHNAGGIDLNRDWAKYRQPEIEQVVTAIEIATKESKTQVIIGLDFHSTWKDVFYTNQNQSESVLPNFVQDWFTGLEQHIPDYKVNEDSSTSKIPVSKAWFLKRYNAVGITYEIGDETPREFIELKGRVSALEMMRLLLQ